MFNCIRQVKKDIWVILFLLFVSIYTIFNLKHWNESDRIIVWDVISYYGYLPAAFIYGDVTLQNPNEKYNTLDHNFWYHETLEKSKVFKTSMGMAILYSPFFFLSHIYVLCTDGEASGFSTPYRFGIAMSSLFYLIFGLIFLRKILKNYYNTSVISYTLLFVGLGTNLYYYTVIQVGMPHLYLLTLCSILFYLLNQWYEKPTYLLGCMVGLLGGLIVLVRPVMIIMIVLALFLGINSMAQLKDRVYFYRAHFVKIPIVLFSAFFIWIPQFLYWKMTSGSYLFYSYTEERFFFTDPQIFNALFSFRKGWLLYTPIMIFALIGFVMMLIKKDKNVLAIIFTVALYFYVATCWWDWSFGGGFGYRTMIEMFPLLAFGLAAFLSHILNYSRIYKNLLLSVMFLLLGFNLFQTRQAHEGLLHHDSMTKEAYSKILFKLQNQISIKEVEPFLKEPDYDRALKGERDL